MRWMPISGRAPAAVTLVTLLVCAGCGDPGEEAARDVAERFTEAADGDTDRACDLLAPVTRQQLEQTEGKPCGKALGSIDVPSGDAGSAEVAGHTAQVMVGGEPVFLSLFDDGWRVVAAACKDTSDDQAVPYDCDVEGR